MDAGAGRGRGCPSRTRRVLVLRFRGAWQFSYDPGWTGGEQVSVSIVSDEVQNRYGQVDLKAKRSTRTHGDNNIVYGKSHYTYARGTSRFGRGGLWDLQNLRVTTDKTGDTDPVWITATFRAPNESVAWTGYWEGQFDDFHTLFLRWIYHVDGIGEGAATYTLPLRTARYRRRHPAVQVRPRHLLHMGAHVQGISTKTPGPGKPLHHLRRHAGPAKARHGEGRRRRR